jgi:hypothetical protein
MNASKATWFSGFVRMGKGGPVEMITTCKVHAVSDGGHDVNCLTKPPPFNSRPCSLQASMNALIQVVDHANERYKADCLGWRDVISGARNLLTPRDLERFAALCNDGHDAIEGEYHLYKNRQSSFLGCPTYIRTRNGVKGHKEDEGSKDKSWGGSGKFNGRREYFLAYHQWIAYAEWLLFAKSLFTKQRLERSSLKKLTLHSLMIVVITLCNCKSPT